MITCGLAGCGFIADFHAASLARVPGVKLQAVCDANSGQAKRFASKWGINAAYSSLETMLHSEQLTAVHILTPPPLHSAAAELCVEQGVNIFLEKPIALTADEGARISTKAEARKVRTGANHNFLFHPTFLALHQAVVNRRLGPVKHVAVHHSMPLRPLSTKAFDAWMFASWENIIFEYFPHPLSLIQRLVGPVLHADCRPLEPLPLKATSFYSKWLAALVCARGTAQIMVDFSASSPEFRLQAIGEDGTADADLRRATVRLTGKNRFDPPIDDLWENMGASWSVVSQSVRSLGRSALDLVTRRQWDNFSRSLTGSIGAFYSQDEGQNRRQFQDAVQVIQGCEILQRSAARHAFA